MASMPSVVESAIILGELGWMELAFMFVVTVLLFLVGRRPDIFRGLRAGLREFKKASSDVGFELGRSVGGIHGKPASEALTPDNRTAELYEPSAFDKKSKHIKRVFRRIWVVVRKLLRF